MRIEQLTALEILDSRGRPTIQVTCRIAEGAEATASVPSGASTGSAEACELRDCDPNRYGGLGTRRAVANVNGEVADAVVNRVFNHQNELDRVLIEVDGTHNKSRLGANAILGVSMSFARAVAATKRVPLYAHFSNIVNEPLRELPRLMINLFSGGMHAGGQVAVQDVLIVPARAETIADGLAAAYDVYQAAAELSARKYGMRPLKADEGGLAPPFESVEQMLDDAIQSIWNSGWEPGRDIALAIDVASSHFHRAGKYHLADRPRDATGMIDTLRRWISGRPIVSVEDGLSEDDWDAWPALARAIGGSGRVLVVGDDLLCTNPHRIARAVETRAADALLLKLNQVGTVTEGAEARQLAKAAGWHITVSARSGETEDHWIADLAVGWGAQQIKVGSIAQSDRLAKYNRLLAIEAETKLPVVAWPISHE